MVDSSPSAPEDARRAAQCSQAFGQEQASDAVHEVGAARHDQQDAQDARDKARLDHEGGERQQREGQKMAVMLVGFGAAILLIAKRSPSLLERGSALGWLCFALAATGFVISLAAFPTPPIALLGLATAAFGIGLRTAPPMTA